MNPSVKDLEESLTNAIFRIVRQEMDKFGNMRGWSATVVSVNPDGTCNVQMPGDTTVISSLKNKTRVVLSAGDEVELHSISTLSSAYIGIAKNK